MATPSGATRAPCRFGTQVASLTKTIKSILDRYPEGGQILKELIQNADDAGASTVKFVVDPREHPTEELLKDTLKPIQGPALLAYNDAMFKPEDWEGIGDLSQSKKAEDVLKVGRFGIGFQSVHHITDLPVIVSGEYVGILDPHRKYIGLTQDDGTIESGHLLELSDFCKHASHSSLFEGMFGFSSKSSEEFKGTIFRFPFRKQDVKSHLSNTVYSADKVISDLYRSFQVEAARILLFLKHVSAIELYTWNTEESCQEKYLTVTISTSCCSEVNLMRKHAESFCERSREESSSAVTDLYTCKVEVTGPAENEISGVQVYNWLICNTLGTSKSSLKQMAKDLKVAPWVGIAVQVPTEFVLATGHTLDWKDFSVSSGKMGIDIVKAYDVLQRKLSVVGDATSHSIVYEGYAFCFLPLPRPTGLPVNVHGYFSVADNRRSIKWPAPDVKGNDAKWNEELVHSLLIPSYAILLAARTKMFSFSTHGDSPYSWWPDPHCVEYSPTWRSIIPDLSSLLLQLPVFWTGADGGKWVSQDGAIFLPPTCPPSVAKLLLQLGFAVVHIPNHVLQCFGKTAIKFASTVDVCQCLKDKSTEAKKMMSSEITVVQEFLEYFVNSCIDFSHLIGLPIILLDDQGMSPAFLQEKDQGDPLYVMLDKSNAAMLPGLEDRIVSFDVPNSIAELYKRLAETEEFQLQIVSDMVVASSLLHMSMRTWCNPDTDVHWTPDKKGHPSRDWLVKVWEWLAKQEVSNSSTEFALVDLAKVLPIVPMESLDNTRLAETILLPLSDALAGVILQMPPEPDEDADSIFFVCQKLGIRIVQFSSALNKLAHQIVPTLNAVALLQALMIYRQSCNMSEVVKALENEEKEKLKKYLEPSVDAKLMDKAISATVQARVDFLKSIPFHTVKDENGICHSTLSAQVIFVAPDVNLPESIPLFQPLLCYTASELGFYKVLLDRDPELLTTLVQNHILPNLHAEEDNSEVYLWILQNLCDSDGHLVNTLKETAFLPSQDGKLHCPNELFDPEDKQLQNFFSARHPAFPHDDFTGHDVVVKLHWLGIQTWPTICSTEQSFIAFVLAQAKCLANVSREEGLKKSEHLVREIASSEFCQEAFAALADVPFLFCEMCPPSDNVSSLSWFGELHGEKAHKPTEIYASAGSNLSLVIGSVCPILSKEYRNVPDLVNMCRQEAPSHVVAQLRNVACLPEHVLQEEGSRVTLLIHQVYSYLNTNASSVIELDVPPSVWHPQQAVFVPLTKVALYPIDTLYTIPYRFDVGQLDDMGQYMKLWKALGMRDTLDITDCEEVLLEIQAAAKDVSLTADEMKVVLSILQYLKSKSCPKGALLPTKRNGLMNPVQCAFDDCEWLVKHPELVLRYSVVLAEVERELALYFGAVPLSQKIANPTPLEIAIAEHETKPVKALVRERLNLYQCEIDPFLEMIQLADCASATSVKFIFDWRRYAKQSLFSEQMAELQGPALFVIINTVLTEDIVKQLCSIGSVHPNKSEESVPHPSDGCDFCSAYHLSDLPMLWNGTKLLVFDPLQAYVCHLTSKPSHGVQFSTDENMDELQAYYGDQLKPFVEVSSYYTSDVCSVHSSHAIFRLPFRRASKEYTYTLTPHTAEQVVSTFGCIGNSLPVFLQNIKEVEFCEIGAHSDESQIVSLLSVVKATTPAPPVAQSMQSGLECCEVKTTVKNEDSLSKWLVVSQHSNERLHVDVAISVVQENGLMFITSPSNGQKFFSCTILNHTLSPWQNCLVNVCLIAANGKRLRVWPTTGSDELTDAASDSVSSALLRVLTIAQECLSLPGVNLAEQNMDCYYKLWPTDPKQVCQLLRKADSADVPIVYSMGGTWECPRSCVVMNKEFRQPPFLSLCSCFQEIMMYTGCRIAKRPEHIAQLAMSCIEVMNLKTFFEEVFFGNIRTLPVQEMHKALFFILEHYQLLHSMKINLDEKLKCNRCIPTEPYGHLNVPQALIDRSSLTIGRLYSDEDGRFVNCSEKAKATLKELGMKSDKLTDEDVIERARSVSTLTSHVAAKERSRLLLDYISFHECDDSLWDSLSEISFLPAACRQGSSHIFGRRDSLQLHCSKDLYLPQYQKLVFTQCPVLEHSIDPRYHNRLQFKGEPATAVVLNHLEALVECVSAGKESMTPEDWKTIDSSVQAVYEHLNDKAQENADLLKALFEAIFQGRGMIWDSTERCFQKRDTVALKLPRGLSSLHPFRKTRADLECLRQNSRLWKTLEVREEFEVHDCVQVLAEMEGMCSEQPLAEQHIKMVVDILCFMQNYQWKEGALIPTAKGTLCSPEKAVFDDRKWSEKNENLQLRFTFAHSKVPGEVAKYFGVHPVSSKIASPQQLKLKFKVKRSGQRESLTRRLRGIVEDYKDNIDVFKELIQNADDARATKVKFLLDWRQHPRENLFTEELAQWQGPALYAYNDSVFSDEDFANICELGGATKRCNPLKIGRFGLGFCATYHLTDVPSFVSRNQLTIFDPHKQYISDVMAGDSPGLCVDILEGRSDLQDFLSGHVAAYEDLFGCSLIRLGEEGFQGTLFRFPFRTQELAERSEISNKVINRSNVKQLTTMLYDAADTLLVFLRNVASIELYELPPNSHPSDMKQLLTVTKKRLNSPVDLIQRYLTHESQSSGEAAYIQESFEMHEATSRFSIVRQGNDIDKETHWLVASALDGEGSSGSLYTKADEHIPFAQVAVRVVEQNSLWVPCPVINDYLYCFLPLPISTDLKVLVNGYFEVSKDRRSLTDVQDRSQTDTWNTKLIGGAVSTAFLGMLSQLIELNQSSCDATFVEAFYNLWPTNSDQGTVTQLMVPHFFRRLIHGQHTVVPTMGQEWVSITSVYVLEDLFSEKLPSSIRSSAVELLLKHGYKLADIPRSVQETVRHVEQSVALVTFKEYITDCLFSVMGTLEEVIRDEQVLFILKQLKQFDDRSRWLTNLLCASRCVSCEPESRLVSPSDLIDPNSPLACLYSSEEERFPTSKYCEDAVSTSLRELGMKYHKLSDDQVIERASSARTLVGEERKRRISDVLNYLFGTHLKGSQGQMSLQDTLSRVVFLPSATKSSILHLPWSGDAAALYCSQDLYLPQYQELIFTQFPVLDLSIDPRCHERLQFKGNPSIEVVVAHLNMLVDSSHQMCLTSDEWKIIDSSVCAVYQYLNAPPMDACIDSSIEASLQTVSNKGLFVWDSSCKCFLDKRKVALKLPTGLPTLVPYRKCIDQLESSKDYQHLWHLLGIKGEFDEGDCVDVLMEMKAKGQVPEEDIVTAVSILHFLASKEWTRKVLVPTINNEFMNPADVVYDDRKWSEKKETLKTRFSLVHKKIPKDLAEVFGVPHLSSLIASPQNLKIKINLTGQHESLTRRLRGIIEDYRDSIDVLKELLQNADDAGATEVKFLLDWRQHPRENLFTEELAQWQGPALYAYNDSVFSDEDFANICELGGATKRCDPTKIGQFGLGFCSVYNVTDVPSFVSRNRLVMFDPSMLYLKGLVEHGNPGMSINFVEDGEDLAEFYRGHVETFQGVFGCDLLSKESFSGTLFRFPFRTKSTALRSKILNREFAVLEMKESFQQSVEYNLMFLQHVTMVELYEMPKKSSPKGINKHLLVSVTKTTQEKLLGNPVQYMLPTSTPSHSIPVTSARNEASPVQDDPTKYQCKTEQFSIRVYCKGSEERTTTWLVSSAVGGKRVKQLGECATGLQKRTLLPKAEVAVRLKEDRQGAVIPHPVQGIVFCFLPLPISVSQKFLINGCFTVSKDRRHLSELEDSPHATNSWNRLLIQEPLTQAVLNVLHRLTTKCYSHVIPASLQEYYSLWPLVTPTDHPLSKELKQSFKKAVHDSDYPLLWSLKDGGMWIPVCEATVLDSAFFDTVFDTVRSEIMCVLVMLQYNMVNISEELYQGLTQGATSVRKVSVLEYYTEVLLPNLHKITDRTVRDIQILFLVTHFQTLKDIAEGNGSDLSNVLKSTCCIPCEPNGKLSLVEDLILPTDTFKILFKEDEDCRFPCPKFLDNPSTRHTLTMLGMHTDTLKEEDVVERAEIVITLPEEETNLYCSTLFSYIAKCHGTSTELLDRLLGIVFLPLHIPDSSLTLPWCEHAKQSRFASPKDVYHPSALPLVFTFAPVADKELVGPCLDIFKLKHTPSGEDVWNHTKRLVTWAASCPKEISEEEVQYLNVCMNKIYHHLEMQLSTSPDFFDLVQRECGDLAFLWQDRRFHKPSQMVHSFVQGDSCYPYLVKVNEELSRFKYLLQASRVELKVTVQRVEILLRRIFDDHGSTGVGAKLVCFARALVSAVHSAQQTQGQDRVFYLPDTDEVMQPSTELVNKEFDDSSDINAELVSIMPDSTLYLHTSIPKLEAKRFGVQDVLSTILGQMIDPEFAEEEFEQHEPLEVRISNILAQYRADESIFSEFIQNADDACATEVAFVLDHRCDFGTQSLAVSGNTWKWKTLQKLPSLLIYNNRKFSENDIKGISKLGLGNKQEEANKIGQFGLGFNAAYHVTDCPMFLSHDRGGERENFCVFDPLCTYLPHDRRKPRHGLRYKLKGKEKAAAKFTDQFEPFLLDPMMQVSLPGFFEDMHSTTVWPNGYVVFRLPLTRQKQSSGLRNAEKMTEDKLKKLLDTLKMQAPNMLLFLNHLRRITMVEISRDGCIADWWSIGATSNVQPFASNLNQAIHILKNSDQGIPKTFQHSCDAEMKICCASNSEEQTMQWVVCHRFGGSDISQEMIRDSFEKQHVLPVVAVAAPVGSRANGQLFRSLPVSNCTALPVHIHGQFTVDCSRKFLEGSDWNSALTEIAARAYADLLVYCRQKVSLSKETQAWYYSLFPSSADFSMDVLMPIVPKVYQQLLQVNAEVLLAANIDKEPACLLWHALSHDDEAQNKGWFPATDCSLASHVLISIGINIVEAPTTLQETVESLQSHYRGAVTPRLVRTCLQKMTRSNFDKHKRIFLKHINPLLSYVLQGINEENVAEVEGLPLLLSDTGEFKLIQKDQPLFTLCFVDLIPRRSKCREKFVSPLIREDSCLYVKLQTLQLLTQISAEAIAENVELPRSKVVPVSECNHVVLQLLWEFILKYNSERRQSMLQTIFGSLAIVPTSLNTVVPVNMAHTVLKDRGSVPLLSQLELPVVNFSKLPLGIRTTTSTGHHMDEAALQAIAVATVSPLLCDPSETLPVLAAIEAHEPPVGFQPKSRTDVLSFISFILKCPRLKQYATTLRKLKIFELALKEHTWVSIGKDDVMYAVNCSDFPRQSLQPLQKERIRMYRLYENCEMFFKALGILVPTPVEFYQRIIFPTFASNTFSAEDKINHLEFILAEENMWKDLQADLKQCHFIDCSGKFCSPSQLFDPTVKLLTTFLPKTAFPQPPWSDQLSILKKLGLQQEVSNEEMKRFAEKVQDLTDETVKNKSSVLLKHLKRLIKEANKENKLDKVQKLLSMIADVAFISRFFPPHMATSLTDIGVTQLGIETSGFVCLRGSVMCDGEHASLASLCKPVILVEELFNKPVDTATQRRLCDSAQVAPLSTDVVLQNLLRLVHSLEVCQIMSSTECRRALRSLQDTFKMHYEFLSKNEVAAVRSLKGVPCIFVPSSSGESFQIVQGDKLVERVSHESRPYCHLLCVVPDYLNDASMREFRQQVGIQRSLTASHYLSLLKDIHTDMQEQSVVNSRCDPNLYVAANAAYRDLVLLLCGTEDASRQAETEVASVIEGGDQVYLPSRSGKLLPSEELILCDDDWIQDKLMTGSGEEQIHFEFITTPPPVAAHSLPSCLKVRKLSDLVTEEIDSTLLKDEYNLCTKEVYAKQHNQEHGCTSVITLLEFIQTPEFAVGIQRIMHHKLVGGPLVEDCERALEMILRMGCVCVQKIRTCFKCNGKLIQGAGNQDMSCFLVTEDSGELKDDSNASAGPAPVLYVRFHDNVDDLLPDVMMQLKKVLGPFISDTQHLQAILKCITEPGKIQGALDHLHIKRYTSTSSVPDAVMLSSQLEVEGNELIIACNFRANERVMYCDADGHLKLCTVESVTATHTSGSHALPPQLCVLPADGQGGISSNTGADPITSLLVCKFLSPGQMQQLKALLNGQLADHSPSSTMAGDKLVLLEVPQTDSKQLQRYLANILSLLSSITNDQIYFVIERLLFHLHFLSQVREESIDFDNVAEVFVNQVLKRLKGVPGDHTQFIHSLEKKISVLKGEVLEEKDDVPLSPPLPTTMDQATKRHMPSPSPSEAQRKRTHQLSYRSQYSSLSSWSAYGNSMPRGHRPSGGASHQRVASQSAALPQRSGTSGSSAHGLQPINIWQPSRETFYTPVVEKPPETSVVDAQMWLTQACHDLKLAQQLVDLVHSPSAAEHEEGASGGGPSVCEYPEAVCFYSHEIVEKALKAVFLAYCGLKHELAASNNVVDIFEKLTKSVGCPEEVKSTSESVYQVSRHGRCCRFPDDNLPPAAPVLSHSTATAKEALSAALRFLKAVSKLQLFRDYFPDGTMEISIQRLAKETDTPYHWDEMSDEREYDLYAVLEESPEYWQVASLFRNTLPSSMIVRIERIQNKVLWENYQQKKKRLEKVVHARDIEQLLFHGTSTTEPDKIYAGEVGFDMRMSAHGIWGEGCYFAVNASYSKGYAHRLPSGMSQLLVARVLTGGATHDDRQKGKVLPARTSSDRVKGQIERQYTCVRAFTGGSEIYVTKENSYAYPEYLITFQ